MERGDPNGNVTKDENAAEEAAANERGAPEGSLESPRVPSEMEQSETGRRTSIFKYYSYKSTGERVRSWITVSFVLNQLHVNAQIRECCVM